MGVYIKFSGKFKLSKKLDKKCFDTIESFRNLEKIEETRAALSFENDVFCAKKSYCGWKISQDKQFIEHDGSDKFYDYMEWLEYIIDNILIPNGYLLSGKVMVNIENYEYGLHKIKVYNNKITKKEYSASEIKEYQAELERKSLKKNGEILNKTKIYFITLNPAVCISLYQFFFHKIFKYSCELFLVKEKDGSLNLYKLANNEKLINDQIRIRYQNKWYLSVSNIVEIVHFNSPLYRLFLKSKNVYCICEKKEGSVVKNLYLLHNPKILCQLPKEFQQKIHSSSDFTLIRLLLNNLTIALIILLLTYGAGVFLFLISIELFTKFNLILLLFAFGIIYFYYSYVLQGLCLYFNYFSLNKLFTTNTVSNESKYF